MWILDGDPGRKAVASNLNLFMSLGILLVPVFDQDILSAKERWDPGRRKEVYVLSTSTAVDWRYAAQRPFLSQQKPVIELNTFDLQKMNLGLESWRIGSSTRKPILNKVPKKHYQA